MNLAAEYNEWYRRVFDSDPERRDEETPWYKLVLEYLPSVQGKRVLEIACGRGGFATLLASRGAVTFGADFSETALRIAQEKHQRNGGGACLNYAQADAHALPFASESFDVIVSCETIEHLPGPLVAVKEMARVCRTGGMLFLTTPNYFNAMGLYCIYARLRGRPATPGSDQPFDRAFLFPQVRRMLHRAGWRVVRSDGTVHQLPIVPRHSPITLESLESNRTIRRLLSPFALHYLLIGVKRSARC